MSAALKDADKLARMAKVEEVKNSVKENDFTEEERAAWGSDIAAALKSLESTQCARWLSKRASVPDGRSSTDIRPCTLRLAICLVFTVPVFSSVVRPRLSLLQRLVCSMNGSVLILSILQRGKRYMHQYNFPPYCTGEVGRMGAPKRREIGHGALAERALLPVLPR